MVLSHGAVSRYMHVRLEIDCSRNAFSCTGRIARYCVVGVDDQQVSLEMQHSAFACIADIDRNETREGWCSPA